MHFCTFSSGSCGNAAVVSSGDTSILIDAGLSMRQIVSALKSIDLDIASLSAIVVTHEHSDHTRGLAMLAKHFPDLEIFASDGTARALGVNCTTFIAGDPLSIGNLDIQTFHTPHDTPESTGFTFTNGERRLGYATDLGHVTSAVSNALSRCDTVVLEFNHDVDMLWAGKYPYHIKQRVASMYGHLNNADAAELAYKLADSGTQRLILAHLSEENNRPESAVAALHSRLGKESCCEVAVAAPRIVGCVYNV